MEFLSAGISCRHSVTHLLQIETRITYLENNKAPFLLMYAASVAATIYDIFRSCPCPKHENDINKLIVRITELKKKLEGFIEGARRNKEDLYPVNNHGEPVIFDFMSKIGDFINQYAPEEMKLKIKARMGWIFERNNYPTHQVNTFTGMADVNWSNYYCQPYYNTYHSGPYGYVAPHGEGWQHVNYQTSWPGYGGPGMDYSSGFQNGPGYQSHDGYGVNHNYQWAQSGWQPNPVQNTEGQQMPEQPVQRPQVLQDELHGRVAAIERNLSLLKPATVLNGSTSERVPDTSSSSPPLSMPKVQPSKLKLPKAKKVKVTDVDDKIKEAEQTIEASRTRYEEQSYSVTMRRIGLDKARLKSRALALEMLDDEKVVSVASIVYRNHEKTVKDVDKMSSEKWEDVHEKIRRYELWKYIMDAFEAKKTNDQSNLNKMKKEITEEEGIVRSLVQSNTQLLNQIKQKKSVIFEMKDNMKIKDFVRSGGVGTSTEPLVNVYDFEPEEPEESHRSGVLDDILDMEASTSSKNATSIFDLGAPGKMN